MNRIHHFALSPILFLYSFLSSEGRVSVSLSSLLRFSLVSSPLLCFFWSWIGVMWCPFRISDEGLLSCWGKTLTCHGNPSVKSTFLGSSYRRKTKRNTNTQILRVPFVSKVLSLRRTLQPVPPQILLFLDLRQRGGGGYFLSRVVQLILVIPLVYQ